MTQKSVPYIICQTVHCVIYVRKWRILYGFGMLRRPLPDSVGSVGGARRPEYHGCRPTVMCCMVGRSILNSMIDSKGDAISSYILLQASYRGLSYKSTVYLRRLVFVCTFVLKSFDRGCAPCPEKKVPLYFCL